MSRKPKDFTQVTLTAGTYEVRVVASNKPQRFALTDQEIDDLLPEPDGTAEEVKRRVEYRPGLWADEIDVDDAWSRKLVYQAVRAAIAKATGEA